MGNAVKRAVSLPQEQDEKIRKLSSSIGVSYSKILQKAVEAYLKRRDFVAMEEEYAKYYGNPKNIKKEKDLTEEMWDFAQDVW